jgi:hypothetical protein
MVSNYLVTKSFEQCSRKLMVSSYLLDINMIFVGKRLFRVLSSASRTVSSTSTAVYLFMNTLTTLLQPLKQACIDSSGVRMRVNWDEYGNKCALPSPGLLRDVWWFETNVSGLPIGNLFGQLDL